MALTYGFIKCKVASAPILKPKHLRREIQYHLHQTLQVPGKSWDSAINVGTSDADDLLRYKLIFDFRHSIIDTLRAAMKSPKSAARVIS